MLVNSSLNTGRNASTNEREKAVDLAVKYINLDNTQRNAENTSIIRVNQEKEPVSFTGFFQVSFNL